MINKRDLPVGIQDFEKLRKGGCLYIDKTNYVYQLSRTESPYFLSRPRRFGKSLFLSILKAYFLGKRELCLWAGYCRTGTGLDRISSVLS